SAMERRAIDVTSTARLQFVVFVFGLFHLKMAAADALWRLLVTPKQSHKDATSFMSFVAKLCPTRTGKLTNNVTFCKQHELINNVGEVLRLDAWHVEARRGGYLTLEKWGESKPSLEAIDKFAKTLVSEYVEGEGTNLYQQKNCPDTQRDKQHENIMRTHHYLLLYEELSYAMNEGDIGRVETLFWPWIQIFCSVGKHKYATRMLLFMHQLYKVYPEGLRRAVRYNILVNPTGKSHQFRAVDWVVELLNLFIKEFYGGEGPNHTKKQILDESALVLIYHNCHKVFEQNFLLSRLTYAHAAKDMAAMFEGVLQYIQTLDGSPNKHITGRGAKYELPNVIGHGAAIIMAEANPQEQDSRGDVEMMDKEEWLMWEEIERGGARGVGDEDYWDLTDTISAEDLAAEGAI
ncbi:hypothetical protein BC835DRAFT_1261854, partial [Cytidiella melzeri]